MGNELQAKLTQPFSLGAHKWRVLNVSKKKDKATWYVYIDARDVAQRLDETGLDWSDEYEVIVMTDALCVIQCKLTIGNSTRTDVGSDSKQSNDTEGNYIKGAFSDALKRAAVKFGVGRYLYGLSSFYVPIDDYRRFTPESEQRIKAHLIKELRAIGVHGDESELNGLPADGDDDTDGTQKSQPSQAQNGNHGNVLLLELNRLGESIYGDSWSKVCQHNVERISGGATRVASELSEDAIKKLINGMKKLKRQREAPARREQPEPPQNSTGVPVSNGNGGVEFVIEQCRTLQVQGGGEASKPQYGFLVSTIKRVTQVEDEGHHNAILKELAGREVNGDNRPSKELASELLDRLNERTKDRQSSEWVDNPKYDESWVVAIQTISDRITWAEKEGESASLETEAALPF